MSDQPEIPDRRSFLDSILKGGVAIWGVSMVAPTAVYLWPVRSGAGGASSVSAGPVKDFAVGTGRLLQSEAKPILVIRVSEEVFRAFSPICTHLGCIVKWDAEAKKIRCPCHAGEFDTEGKNVSGPPPRPLPSYAVSVVGTEVVVKL